MARWLFFDIDDTLWDFKGNSLLSLQSLYDNSPLLKEKFVTLDNFLDTYHEKNDEMWRRYANGEISSDFLKTERFRQILFPGSHSGKKAEICAEMNNRYLLTLCRIPRVVEGAIETLETLSRKYMIGAVTNGFSDTQYTKIYTTDLWRYITRMIISDEIGIQKPDRRYFDYVFQATGAEADSSIVIGDNPATDIAGALEAGIDAIFYNPDGKDSSVLNKFRNDNFTDDDGRKRGRLIAEIKDLREVLKIL